VDHVDEFLAQQASAVTAEGRTLRILIEQYREAVAAGNNATATALGRVMLRVAAEVYRADVSTFVRP
jgi:hypothetical protein